MSELKNDPPHPTGPRPPTPRPAPPTEMEGPYDAVVNGTDVYLHPLNGFGRCEAMNTPGGVCPTRHDRQTFLMSIPLDQLIAVANMHNIQIPPVPVQAAIVNLILVAEGL